MVKVVEVREADRRVQRSQQALHDAFFELLVEKGSFEAVSIADVAKRANVGRSTFYTHFVDKEDVLLNSVRHLELNLLAFSRPGSAGPCVHSCVAFVLPMLEHVRDHQRLNAVLSGGAGALVRAKLFELFERRILQALAAPVWGEHNADMDFLAVFIAGAFEAVLTKWLRAGCTPTPLEVDRHFQGMVHPVLVRCGLCEA